MLPKELDTIEDHHNKHTIEDQGCSWTTPLKNCLSAVFKLDFNKASYILGNETFWEFQKNGAKKVKKRKVLAKERKRKGDNDFGKNTSKKMDTIEDHHNKHIIQDQYCPWKKEKMKQHFLQAAVGHNRGPPQQTIFRINIAYEKLKNIQQKNWIFFKKKK